MALTFSQLQTLKAAIDADPLLSSQPNTTDGAIAIREAMNAAATPDFWVFKTNVALRDVGDNLNGTEMAGLSSLNHTRLLTVVTLSVTGINASKADRRQFFDDIFSGAGGATTRANLAVLWRRLSTRAEKLYATGTGSTASPGMLTFEGSISIQNVQDARALP